jgi:hypothetical protein
MEEVTEIGPTGKDHAMGKVKDFGRRVDRRKANSEQ